MDEPRFYFVAVKVIDLFRQLVRPIITIYMVFTIPVLGLKPAMVTSLQSLPTEYWGLLSIVLLFWFGERAVKGVIKQKNEV